MSATISRLVTQPECLEAETAAELRQLVTNFPGLPERARGEIVAAIDRRTAARHAWTFVMLSPEQNAFVVRELRQRSSRKVMALALWGELFTVLDRRTNEIGATREELAVRIDATPNDVTRIMSELVRIGAIERRRVPTQGVRGKGRVVYAMNPNVATQLSGPAREEAQDASKRHLVALDGGRI